MTLVAMLVARLLDPILIIVAAVLGAIVRQWWHVLAVAVVAASIQEFALFGIQLTRVFDPLSFFMGFLAAAIWAALAFWLRSRWRRSKA
jgi:hypothetical protein